MVVNLLTQHNIDKIWKLPNVNCFFAVDFAANSWYIIICNYSYISFSEPYFLRYFLNIMIKTAIAMIITVISTITI